MKAWVISVSVALMAANLPAGAALSSPPQEDDKYSTREEREPRDRPSSQWRREDRQQKTPGGRCRSQADAKATAEDFCEGQLNCSSMSPPKAISCTGQPGRWICTCV